MGRTFVFADAVNKFLAGHNFVVEDWIKKNWHRVDGMTGGADKSRVSRALAGKEVTDHLVDALDLMYQEMHDDPWEWCKPPDTVDGLKTDWRPLTWWYKTLGPAMPEAMFTRMASFPLKPDDRDMVAELLAEWSSRLRGTCDRFKADTRLVRAAESDMRPEYDYWIKADRWIEVDDREWDRFSGEKRKPRVGNSGLYGCTPEEVGQAYALMDATRPLPDVQAARLAYAQPRGVAEHDHLTEAVEPWNGDEFESWETSEAVMPVMVDGRLEMHVVTVRHDVIRYWDGERYQVEDVRPFALILDDARRTTNEKPETQFGRALVQVHKGWREPTREERERLETGMIREYLTREEWMAENPREEWVANRLAYTGDDLTGVEKAMFNPWTREQAEEGYETVLSRVDETKALDERREIAQRRMAFKRTMRRRL